MASRIVVERITLNMLRHYHHATLNTMGENETLVEAISLRPGIYGISPIGFLSVLARRPEARLRDLEEAIVNDKSLIRASAFRGGLFVLDSSDYCLYFRALFPFLKNRGMNRLLERGICEKKLLSIARVLENSQISRPMTAERLGRVIYPGRAVLPAPDVLRASFCKLCDLGILVRVAGRGWKGNQFSFALTSRWMPEIRLRSDNPESARTETVRKYLRAYGPATIEDIAWWTGLSDIQVLRAIHHLKREAVRFVVESYREELHGLRESIDAIRSPKILSEAIQFLPPWDPYLLGWKNRKRLIDRAVMPWVVDLHLNACSTIVHMGKVIGLWQYRDGEIDRLEYHVFKTYAKKRRLVQGYAEEFASKMAGLSGASRVLLVERELIEPLYQRPAGAFLWPLGKKLKRVGPGKAWREPSYGEDNKFRGSYLDNPHIVRPGFC